MLLMERCIELTGEPAGVFLLYQGAHPLRLPAELSKSSHESRHLHFVETSEVGVVDYNAGQEESA